MYKFFLFLQINNYEKIWEKKMQFQADEAHDRTSYSLSPLYKITRPLTKSTIWKQLQSPFSLVDLVIKAPTHDVIN